MKIGPYEVLSEIGRGGMGAVYRARLPDGRDVALKVLLRADPERVARFGREKRLLAALGEEDGFVTLLDAGTSQGGPWIAMAFVPGGTLRDRMRHGALPTDEAVRIARILAASLGRAHERGIVHRDLKPENVLFTANGHPLVADLGLAKHFDRSAPGASQSVSLSQGDRMRGTAGYMAPEQIADASAAGPAADVFSLGAILYECLAGAPAFEGPTMLELLSRVATGRVTPLGSEVPPWLASVVARSLEPDPAKRIQDGVALSRALREEKAPARSRALPVVGLLGAACAALVFLSLRAPRAAPAPVPVPAPQARDLVARARAKRLKGDVAGALADATTATELDPRLAAAWTELAAGQVKKGDFAAAEKAARRALALDAKDARAWDFLGVCVAARSDYDEEIVCCGRAIELDPKLVSAWSNRSAALIAKRENGQAAVDAAKAVELDPSFELGWENLAAARANLGDYKGAIECYDRALAIEPENGAIYFRRGVTREFLADWRGAMVNLDRAIALAPREARFWFSRAHCQRMLEQWDAAIRDASEAISLDPKLAPAYRDRALARSKKGEADLALADAEETIRLDPSAESLSLRASLRIAKGDWDGAASDARRSLELDPAFAGPWGTLQVVYMAKLDWAKAIDAGNKAIERDPNVADYWANRALARSKAGDRAGAIADYRHVLELVPGDIEALKALKELGQ